MHHSSPKLPASEAYKLHSLRFASRPQPRRRAPRPTLTRPRPTLAGRRISGPATA